MGALMLATWHDAEWVYVGRVGTGFSDELLRSLAKTLRPQEVKTPTANAALMEAATRRKAHWVEPALLLRSSTKGSEVKACCVTQRSRLSGPTRRRKAWPLNPSASDARGSIPEKRAAMEDAEYRSRCSSRFLYSCPPNPTRRKPCSRAPSERSERGNTRAQRVRRWKRLLDDAIVMANA